MTDEIADVICEDANWEGANLTPIAQRSIGAVVAYYGADPAGYLVAVLGCDDQRIASLNADFRNKPRPTNVLSWPASDLMEPGLPPAGTTEDPTELGDIAIAFETCVREAKQQGKTIDAHVTHLLIHATLHLLGYDHEEDDEAELMEATEKAILASIGISDPYI